MAPLRELGSYNPPPTDEPRPLLRSPGGESPCCYRRKLGDARNCRVWLVCWTYPCAVGVVDAVLHWVLDYAPPCRLPRATRSTEQGCPDETVLWSLFGIRILRSSFVPDVCSPVPSPLSPVAWFGALG